MRQLITGTSLSMRSLFLVVGTCWVNSRDIIVFWFSMFKKFDGLKLECYGIDLAIILMLWERTRKEFFTMSTGHNIQFRKGWLLLL